MEHLDGETLASRLQKGPLLLPQLLAIGAGIAGALDRAHRAGIVHRDLKPGNVFLTKDGAKLLDFGLAKASLGAKSPEFSAFATEAEPLTGKGAVLGTVQYMAPEQLEGKEADARTDLFALGLVLYEMATGKRAFSGTSQASLISAILRDEPQPISALVPMSPPALESVVKACLAKDPDERWQSAHDVKRELAWIAEGGSQPGQPGAIAPVAARRRNRETLAWSAFALALLAAITLGIVTVRRAPQSARLVRAAIPLPEKMFLGEMVLSPDGSTLAYTASKPGGQPQLWIRSLDAASGQPVAGTEGANFPFWSPDGRFVAFITSDGKLKRITPSGGSLLTICDAERGVGGTWNQDGTILFAPTPTSPLYRVPAGGGPPVAVTKLDPSRKETAHRYPQFLPDGRRFLYTSANLSAPIDDPANRVRLGSLDGKEDRALVAFASSAVFGSGHLLYARDGR